MLLVSPIPLTQNTHTTMPSIKAIIINAKEQKVYEADLAKDSFEAVRDAIGVEWITRVSTYDRKHSLYVDDEGLINGTTYGFILDSAYPEPLAGSGCLIGLTPSGNDTNCKLDVEAVRSSVRFWKR